MFASLHSYRQEKLLTHINDTHLRCLNFDFKLPEGLEWQIKAYKDFLLEMQQSWWWLLLSGGGVDPGRRVGNPDVKIGIRGNLWIYFKPDVQQLESTIGF